MKPIKMALGPDGDYHIDALVREGTALPEAMQTSLRNLLLACELGALVVVQCTRIEDDATVYVLCAYAAAERDNEFLLPICELNTTRDMMLSLRPPSLANTKLRKPKFSDTYINLLPADEGVTVLAEVVKRKDDESVH
jgi:hypothetical protein